MTNPQEVLDHIDTAKRMKRAKSKNPRIEVNQRWIAYGKDGEISRRIRILAEHPDGGWIYMDEPSKMIKATAYELRWFREEFNLRYVFELER